MKDMLLMTSLSLAIITGSAMQTMAKNNDSMRGGPRHSFEELDANGDGQITRAEMKAHHAARFVQADSDGNGTLSADELIAQASKRAGERMAKHAPRMISRHDGNGDGELSMAEMSERHKGDRFGKLDSNGDGTISADEFAAMKKMRGRYWGQNGGTE